MFRKMGLFSRLVWNSHMGSSGRASSVPVLPDAAVKVEREAEVAPPERASSRTFRTIKEALRQIALAHQRIVVPLSRVQSSAKHGKEGAITAPEFRRSSVSGYRPESGRPVALC